MKLHTPHTTTDATAKPATHQAATLSSLSDADCPLIIGHRGASKFAPENTLAAVAEVKRIAPDLCTAAAFERRLARPLLSPRTLLRQARDCRADELALGRSLVSRRMIEAAHDCGLPSVVWTVDHPSWAKRASALGLHAIITNDPARMRAAPGDSRKQQGEQAAQSKNDATR